MSRAVAFWAIAGPIILAVVVIGVYLEIIRPFEKQVGRM